MTEHASYIYTTYSEYLSLSNDQILQVGWNNIEDSNPIPSFDESLLINLCADAKNIFENEDILLKINGDTTFVGDIHGSFHDLLRILNYVAATPNKILFLGDYVDRGNFSLECITLLFTYKVLYPDKYFLLRGNHEFDSSCCQYGFKKEILNYHNPQKIDKSPSKPIPTNYDPTHINLDEELKKASKKSESPEKLCDTYFANHVNIYCYKYTENLYDSFIEAFSYLPIAAIVNNTTFCIHGGLSPQLDKIEKIESIKRPIYDFDQNQLLTDLLWSDPSPDIEHFFCDNPRGMGKLFNKTATLTFLKNNNLQRIVRAHECINKGFDLKFSEKCITVFSASSYDKDLGNKSSIIELFEKDDTLDSIIFSPINRLKKFDTFYYKVKSFENSEQKAPVLARYMSGPMYDSDKSEQNSDHSKSLANKKTSSRRRASFSLKIPFNTGLKLGNIKSNCPFSPKDSSHNNIPHLNNWRFSDESARESSLTNRACLPTLSKKFNV
ncbi:hypothetical protein M9Y10_042628 [Tritrichomonas musculus]|uniref:Serine/threonine-protein phosphatase n=1 Tax=Tritrichomonas musculus TaxID=1915356 RepID=A0ABR2JXE7_9EUKA